MADVVRMTGMCGMNEPARSVMLENWAGLRFRLGI